MIARARWRSSSDFVLNAGGRAPAARGQRRRCGARRAGPGRRVVAGRGTRPAGGPGRGAAAGRGGGRDARRARGGHVLAGRLEGADDLEPRARGQRPLGLRQVGRGDGGRGRSGGGGGSGGALAEGEAALEHGLEDLEVAFAGRAARDVDEGRARVLVPGRGEDLGERRDGEGVAIGREHRADAAPTVGVGPRDDTVLLDALEHRPLGLRREGLDRKPQALGTVLSHRVSTSSLCTSPADRAGAYGGPRRTQAHSFPLHGDLQRSRAGAAEPAGTAGRAVRQHTPGRGSTPRRRPPRQRE